MLTTLLLILFVFASIVLIVVILLQEGKGGGFGQALGEHGQATFGVGASGINKFTAATAVVFLVSALAIHHFTRESSTSGLLQESGGINLLEAGSPDDAAPAGESTGTGDAAPTDSNTDSNTDGE